MSTAIKIVLTLLIFVGILAGGGFVAGKYLKELNRPRWKTSNVALGTIKEVVNATGEVKPIQRVQVGANVSGPVSEIYVDFNSRVSAGDLMAIIDPRLYKSAVQRDEATLATQQAEIQRVTALLQQAKNEEKRLSKLRTASNDFVSETELDQAKFNRMSLEAQLTVAQASVEQAVASLENSRTNLTYTEIRAPVSGIVIDRKVDPGQSLASQFQTPELFVVAPEMDQRMHIYASVDEADIGLVRRAQEEKRPVSFTVDAYPEQLFTGIIHQVRLSSEKNQNVITYPVIVEATNGDLRLLPGLTATLSFSIQSREKVLKVPNAALRFYPERDWVHPDDRKILDGLVEEETTEKSTVTQQSAEERATAETKRKQRHVWVSEGEFLRARAVRLGIADNQWSELAEGDLKDGDALVTARDLTPRKP
jgi:HlyD family secretion protein